MSDGPFLDGADDSPLVQLDGMSKLDRFAAAALPAAWHIAKAANDSGEFNKLDVNMSTLIAMSAYSIAEAMLAESERRSKA